MAENLEHYLEVASNQDSNAEKIRINIVRMSEIERKKLYDSLVASGAKVTMVYRKSTTVDSRSSESGSNTTPPNPETLSENSGEQTPSTPATSVPILSGSNPSTASESRASSGSAQRIPGEGSKAMKFIKKNGAPIAIGAAFGTLFMPGIGTAAGALAGSFARKIIEFERGETKS